VEAKAEPSSPAKGKFSGEQASAWRSNGIRREGRI